jgi:hypothetical protein
MPDIALPDMYDFIDFREDQLPGALLYDSLLKKTYYTPLDFLPLEQLVDKSRVRVAGSEVFQVTARCSRKLAEFQVKLDSVSLLWSDYNTLIADEAKDFSLLAALTEKPTEAFKVGSHAFDRQRMERDPFIRQINEVWIKNLSKDRPLEEAFFIMRDYIAITSTK